MSGEKVFYGPLKLIPADQVKNISKFGCQGHILQAGHLMLRDGAISHN